MGNEIDVKKEMNPRKYQCQKSTESSKFSIPSWTAFLSVVLICGSCWISVFRGGASSSNTQSYSPFSLPKFLSSSKPEVDLPWSDSESRSKCQQTCSLEVVESIPENLTFGDAHVPRSTFDAWQSLIQLAQHEIDIAAYKSSLRGKHVLGDSKSSSSQQGEQIFDLLVEAGRDRGVGIRMVENYPPKDSGDNADGKSLARRGALQRRSLHFSKLFGAGTMHSKFLVVDETHFYMGSANLDWRSLNQKMELGVLIMNCPCLAHDMKRIFGSYWALTALENVTKDHLSLQVADTVYNRHAPLTIFHKGVETQVYLATSPADLNGQGRTWDLDAILTAIDQAQKYIYIHVMDYVPLIAYRHPQKYWPVIDDALRKAMIERGVEVKLLTAALHFVPQSLRFLKSLQSLDGVSSGGSAQVRIFRVPAVTEIQSVIARERRTHNKFMVTETTVIIGTSNWSGDYFVGNTGVALHVTQNHTDQRPFIDEMRQIFVRDWNSEYAHSLTAYMKVCLHRNNNTTLCEVEKEHH